ncbi:hypothetical protein AVEN_159512-1 [Araneus ventricosus]|uniref:Uncharacterized protein n=1 Tax=Araneus ventricosus TaxID=182803 RepID=A0A4Y2A1W0_ARAVE|nr:hypothetical protein AVEN_159512-1 [Araneus ventricosus]
MDPACNSRKCQDSRKKGCDTIPGHESSVDIKSTKRKTVKGDDMRQRMSSLFHDSTLRDQITCDKWTDLQYIMKFRPSDTHAFYDSIPCEEQSRRQVVRKGKSTESTSDGKNKKVKIDVTSKKKKGVKKDKKIDDCNPAKSIFRKMR